MAANIHAPSGYRPSGHIFTLIAKDPKLQHLMERLDTFRSADSAHDLLHVLRVANWAVKIAGPTLDTSEVVASALLHDIAVVRKGDSGQSDAEQSANIAKVLLLESGFSQDASSRVVSAIREHSYSLGILPSSSLGCALQDADRIDALGAIGFFRLISTASTLGSKYYDLGDPWARGRDLNEKQYAVDHIFTKLLKLPETLHSEAGRREAQKRRAFMQIFLTEFAGEIDSLRELTQTSVDTTTGTPALGFHSLRQTQNISNSPNVISTGIVFVAPDEVRVVTTEIGKLKPNRVRVRSLLSGVSHGTELNLLNGSAPGFSRHWDESLRLFDDSGGHKRYPLRPGYECVGRVIEVGSEVKSVDIGTLVWLDRPHDSIHDVEPREIHNGALPEAMAPEKAVFWALTRVAVGAVHDGQIKTGDNVCVLGLGSIGLIAVQLAQQSGARTVIGVDRSPRRLFLAAQLGAQTINFTESDVPTNIKLVTANLGADVVIEASGTYLGLQAAIAACAVGGRVVCVSSYQGEAHDLRLGDEFHRNRISLVSSMTVNNVAHRDHPRWNLDRLNATAKELLYTGRIQVEPLISHRFAVQDAREAYALCKDPEATIKIVFDYGYYDAH